MKEKVYPTATFGRLADAENAYNELLRENTDLKAKVASMEKDVAWLGDLEEAGVDNWQGIDYARDLRRERLKEDEEEDD